MAPWPWDTGNGRSPRRPRRVIRIWMCGVVRHRPARLVGAVVGVALTVGLLGAIGAFIVTASAGMTARAIGSLPVDWQVQVLPAADLQQIADAMAQTAALRALQRVGYASVIGFQATAGGTVQTTAAGQVLGLEPAYAGQFPGQIELLIGAADGVLLAQQTAANLHVGPGDIVSIERQGLSAVDVRIDGIVAMPNQDAMFQAVGMPPGAAPQAPPDNVLLLPMADWHAIFEPQGLQRPDSVRMQLHAGIDHGVLPADPQEAFVAVEHAARHLESQVAGSALVADNLAARLDGAREDALYARVLFLFLGVPGAILSAVVTLVIAASGMARRRQE